MSVVAKTANSLLGRARKKTEQVERGETPSAKSLVRHLECWVRFWAPQYRRDMDVLE